MVARVTVFGDFNLSADEVEEITDQIPGARLARGRGPDHAIVDGADVLAVRRLGKLGSDTHEAIVFVVKVDDVTVRTLLWNVWVGQRPTAVRETLERLIREHDLDIIVLNEAYKCRRELRQHLDGWAVHQGPNIGEGADCAVLVHRRHEIRHRGVMQMRRGWTVVSKGKTKTGREYPFVRVRLNGDGPVLRVLGIHFPTDHPVNDPATDESIRRTIRWARPKRRAGMKELP